MRPESPTRVECILTLEMRETTWAVRAAQYRRNIVATPNFQLKKCGDAYGAKIGMNTRQNQEHSAAEISESVA